MGYRLVVVPGAPLLASGAPADFPHISPSGSDLANGLHGSPLPGFALPRGRVRGGMVPIIWRVPAEIRLRMIWVLRLHPGSRLPKRVWTGPRGSS